MPDKTDYDEFGFDHVCRLCKWYAEETGVCVNYASDWLADFVLPNNVCPEWEGKKDGKRESD